MPVLQNKELRREIAEMIYRAKEGHIPSSFSIVDILHFLYKNRLFFHPQDPSSPERDYFILSKGHGGAALYVVLKKFGILSPSHLASYGQYGGILGGHPDATKVPGAEASTGSLGHGFPTAAGIALGLKIQKKKNKVYALLGDGECNEGTIWETALVAARQSLDNLTAIVDLNGSAAQILPVDPLLDKWKAFGWNAIQADGHSDASLEEAFSALEKMENGRPSVLIAETVKGKGVNFVEGHGKWHHKIPSEAELEAIFKELA